MLFFYVRHGDPIYNPDSLTPLGERQAEAVGKRLAMFGIDEIYASTSERAKLTAKPLSELLKKEITLLDMCTSGMTVIEFKNEGVYAYPKILMLSSDAHLYKEGLPTGYNGRAPF